MPDLSTVERQGSQSTTRRQPSTKQQSDNINLATVSPIWTDINLATPYHQSGPSPSERRMGNRKSAERTTEKRLQVREFKSTQGLSGVALVTKCETRTLARII